MDEARVSVVIVSWNGAAQLPSCLAALVAQTVPPHEIVVVDNGSTDDSVPLVRSRFPSAHLVEAGANLGFAEGCNRGIEASSGDWILTLNNDALASPTLLEEARRAIAALPASVGMIQPRIALVEDGCRTNSTGLLLFTDGCSFDRDDEAPLRPDDQPGPVFCPTAGAAFYRRSMLDQVKLASGWFDAGFFMYVEDLDLGWRCRLAGWDCIYWPGALVRHTPHGTSSRRGRFFVRVQCKKNRLRTLVKNASAGFLVRSLPRTLADLVRIPLMGGPVQLGSVFTGFRQAWLERRAVEQVRKVRREQVEREWAGRRPSR